MSRDKDGRLICPHHNYSCVKSEDDGKTGYYACEPDVFITIDMDGPGDAYVDDY